MRVQERSILWGNPSGNVLLVEVDVGTLLVDVGVLDEHGHIIGGSDDLLSERIDGSLEEGVVGILQVLIENELHAVLDAVGEVVVVGQGIVSSLNHIVLLSHTKLLQTLSTQAQTLDEHLDTCVGSP